MTTWQRWSHLFSYALLVSFLGIYSQTSLANPKISLTGSISRTQNVKKMQLDLVINNVAPADLAVVNQDLVALLHNKIEIYIGDENQPLRYASEDSTVTGKLEGFLLEKREDYTYEVDEDDGNVLILEFKFNLIDNGAETGLQEILDTNNKAIDFFVEYTPAEGNTAEAEFTITQKLGVANAAPEGLKVNSEFRGLSVEWTKASSIPFNDATEGAPEGAVVFVIDTTALSSATDANGLAAVTYKEIKENESVDDTCDFVATIDSCSITCEAADPNDAIYLSAATLSSRPGITVATVSASKSSVNIPDLDPENDYAVFAMYLPDGLKQSECLLQTPKLNSSLNELYGANEAEQSDPRCFIATAAYGSPLAQHVATLRWFRDTYLLRFSWSQKLVEAYYHYSPTLARIITDEPGLRRFARAALWLPVQYVQLLQKSPRLTLGGTSLIFFMLVYFAATRFLGVLITRGKNP